MKDKVLKDHESQELIINRQYKINISEIFTETLLFSFVGQEIKIEISGLIGYYFKFTRATGLTSMQQSNPLSGTLDVKKLNNEASNTYLRPRDNHLAFVLLLLVIVHVQLYHKLFALLLDEVAGGTRNLEEKVQDLSLPFDHYIYYYVL